MDDDDGPVCPLPQLKKDCEPKCVPAYNAYKACLERIKAKGGGDCEPYYFDWLSCIDKCAMPHIMHKLK
ncbi:ubiquinol-cytochrome C reductase hinge domain-containing protein [Pelagophyceae sp. CCMP2097]|nr:ubiquinol-cytochrome C reductase hinge domain-containing protein [Pelagophyceae sp. CCMP2097]